MIGFGPNVGRPYMVALVAVALAALAVFFGAMFPPEIPPY
jgi:hypothetical protein